MEIAEKKWQLIKNLKKKNKNKKHVKCLTIIKLLNSDIK